MTGPTYGRLVRIEDDVDESARSDGRTAATELRAMTMKPGFVSRATGSSFYEAGHTKVFCAVHGPRPSTSASPNAATLSCEIRWSSYCSTISDERSTRGTSNVGAEVHATARERELSAALSRALSASAKLTSYPKCEIAVSTFVLEDDGNAFGAAITAASLALCDAGIELYDVTAACTVAVVDDGIVLDPCIQEEKRATACITVAYQPSMRTITALIQTGALDVQQYADAVDHCTDAAEQVSQVMRSCLVRHATKQLRKQNASRK